MSAKRIDTADGKGWHLTLGKRLKTTLIATLATLLVRITVRLCPLREIRGEEHLSSLLRDKQPLILCLWHGRLLYLTWFVPNRFKRAGVEVHTIVSRSKDGELMARVARFVGVDVVRGSSSRGGPAGLLQLGRRMRQGGSVVTVGDGPRGPRYVLTPGPAALAKLSGAPVLPIAFAAEKAWILETWDQAVIPKPLSRIAVVIGEPFKVNRDATNEDVERATAELEERMEATRLEADAIVRAWARASHEN